MLTLGALGFAAPWTLAALAALPALWFLLRALPPAPRLLRFPGTALLLGLEDRSPEARRTPWWLLLLRLTAIAAAIIAAAGPIWRPAPQDGRGQGPLLIVLDAGWAAAPGWDERIARARAELDAAGPREAALLIADGRATGVLPFAAPSEATAALGATRPASWPTRYPDNPETILAAAPGQGLDTLWLSDGLDHPGRAALAAALAARGTLRVVPPPAAPVSLTLIEGGALPSLETASPDPTSRTVLARGPDPQGIERVLARLTPGPAETEAGLTRSAWALDLPPELRNRVTRFEVEGVASAGAVWLADDRTRRRKVAIVTSGAPSEGQVLLSPQHYLREALGPTTDLVEGGLDDVLPAAPDVILLPDQLIPPDDARLGPWVESGGTLIRFAGPRMAAAEALDLDPLLPLRLRPGGRDVGGALSWGDPRGLAPFPADGPFAGLDARAEVAVRAQLMAEPGPDVAARTLASLSDGTPLVTRVAVGEGQILLVHVTASPDWSDLPLTGLFVQMLNRLVQSARGMAQAGIAPDAPQLAADTPWSAEAVLDGFGRSGPPAADLAPVSGEALDEGPAPGRPAGVWAAGERRRALNAGGAIAVADWQGVQVEAGTEVPGTAFGGWLLALAAALLALDALASAALMHGRRPRESTA
ncbi:BatA domain-containing protein [Paracoccus sp. S-4012]|uniref:BatA domain-containing protein n=1 Tax=Paracoccus sp. S-4012 TaxID=2665648 RepID=UPI001E5773BB|nr:BatA domain-containing protein [Paracoccus sp. S-4012]